MKKRMFRLGALCCAAAMTITTGAQALSVEEAYDILQRSYVDKLPRAAQDAKSLDELFSYTDDYTYYMTAEEYQAFLQGVEGDVSFAGIGAEITYVPEGIRIVSVLKGGGAEKAGLAAGDIIIAIEGESCAPGGAEHRAKLLGEAGTSVTVTVRHADGTQADYTVTRALVTQTNTTVSVTGGVGYIDCDSFGTQTGTYFQEGVRGNDSAVRAWIVDLRGNGGGLTSAAVSALGAFSGEGDLIYFVDQDGESTAQRYSGKDLTDKPAIVLMDSGSASASEIFAGGVLGTGSGIVIGTRSYGKGVAQVLYDESNCPYLHGDAVKVTAYRFYCAGGNTTDRIGVVPTLYIPQDQAVAAARQLAQLLLRAVEALARHGVERHVRRARLIRMVRAPVFKRRAGQRHARLKTARRAHIGDFARFAELARARDGIVIHDAAGVQTLGAGKVHRRGRRIGREGIGGVDVVVHIASGLGRGLAGQQRLQVLKRPGRVEQLQDLFAGFCHRHLHPFHGIAPMPLF